MEELERMKVDEESDDWKKKKNIYEKDGEMFVKKECFKKKDWPGSMIGLFRVWMKQTTKD